MKKDSKINKQLEKLQTENAELLADLQRTRADFENFRKNVDAEKDRLSLATKQAMILKLLPVIDGIDQATNHLPAELEDNSWATGVLKLNQKLVDDLSRIGVRKIKAEIGQEFNPDQHSALLMDEETEGEAEVIAEVLQPGYWYDDQVMRPASVKVARQ